MPPAINSNLAGFGNNQQQSHMVFYVGTDGEVHQLLRYQGAWSDNALLTLCQHDSGNRPPNPTAGVTTELRGGTPLAGYGFGSQNNVFYLAGGADSLQIECLYGGLPDANNWNSFAFSSANTQPAAGQTGTLPDPAAFWGGVQGLQPPGPLVAFAAQPSPAFVATQHVLYFTAGGHVIDLYNNGDGWLWKDRTESTGSLPAAEGSPLAGFLAPGASPQVFFIAADNRIQHFYQQADGEWGVGDLSTALPTAPFPIFPPHSLAAFMSYFENTSHVIYFAPPEGLNILMPLHELYWQNHWIDHEPNLDQVVSATPAYTVSALAGWSCEYEQSEHVIYCPEMSPAGILYELYHNSSGWNMTDFRQSVGLDSFQGPVANSPLLGYAAEYEHTDHVWYIDGNACVHELYRSGNSWQSGETAC